MAESARNAQLQKISSGCLHGISALLVLHSVVRRRNRHVQPRPARAPFIRRRVPVSRSSPKNLRPATVAGIWPCMKRCPISPPALAVWCQARRTACSRWPRRCPVCHRPSRPPCCSAPPPRRATEAGTPDRAASAPGVNVRGNGISRREITEYGRRIEKFLAQIRRQAREIVGVVDCRPQAPQNRRHYEHRLAQVPARIGGGEGDGPLSPARASGSSRIALPRHPGRRERPIRCC